MNMIVKADAGGFIWVVVGIFWIVAQIAGAAAKKKQPPPRPRPGEGNSPKPGDPFAELLRNLAGEQEFRTAEPLEVFAEEEEDETPWEPGEIEALPTIEPLRQTPPAPEPVILAEEISVRPAMKAFRNTLPAMKLPTMTLRFQPLEKSSGKVPILGKTLNSDDRQSVRRAMLSHIIFSPPKALEGMR